MNRNQGSLLTSIYTVIALAITMIFFFPLFWFISLSLRKPIDTYTVNGFGIPWINFTPTLDNWIFEFQNPELIKALLNTTTISISATFLALVIGLPAAYALARFRFYLPPNKDLTIWFFALRALPPVALAVPFFVIFNMIGLFDTKLGMIVVITTFIMPFVIVIVRQTFIDLPIELEEAAMVDGATHIGAFLKVAVPLSVPIIVVSVIIMFSFAWNDYFFGLVLTIKNLILPIHISRGIAATSEWGTPFWFIDPKVVSVRSLIAMSLPVMLALLAQRYMFKALALARRTL